MKNLLSFALAWLVLALSPERAFACDFEDEDGLDVALVLSGGGAKASTQVGVMQVMEELDIPVHCITGTSMGSVVGAFYAAGYSPDEIAGFLTNEATDWGEIFRGRVPRRDKSFIEKTREENYFSGNVASLTKNGVHLPGGIASMQGLKLHFRNILAHVPLEQNFDDLDIPFRAVATDLATGEAKAFAKGDIVESILASMTVPGLFAPREINGELYVDGGISASLPVALAKDMGADIIIALDVSVKPEKKRADISVAATTTDVIRVILAKSVRAHCSAAPKHHRRHDLAG
jgi:NTE family protein